MPRKLIFGLSARAIVLSAVVVLVFVGVGGTLWAVNHFYSGTSNSERRPELKPLPPLQPVTKTSQIVAPVAVAALAIRDVLEAQAPRDANGTRDNPYSDLLGKSQITWSAARGPLQVVGVPPGINISTAVNGSAQLSGQTTNEKGNIANRLSGILGGRAAQLARGVLDQRADIRGNVTITARPALLPNWRFEPNLSGEVALGDVNFAGFKINIANEIKPTLDKAVNEQMTALSNHLRDDPMLETAVRREWGKICRSISLGAASADAPPLWLEVRPTKAFAAQPRIVTDWVIMTVGVQAETRIVPNATKPECPFPARLDIVPQLEQGKIAVAVPIDVPLAELNRVMQKQLNGKTFPEDGNAPGHVMVLSSTLAASGDRLLVSMRVKMRETTSWFGFGTEATVHIWGKPTLDQDRQLLRLSDVSLDVESEAAYGLLGAAARAAMPILQSALTERAVIDLKPFADNAKKSIEGALAEFKKPVDGIEVEADISGLRLVGIEFDSKTLRVIGEAQGSARALVRKIAVP